MNKERLGLRIGMASAAGALAAGCAGAGVPTTGGALIDMTELPALPEINLAGLFQVAPQMHGHAAEGIFHPYIYMSPNPLCEH